MAPQESEFSVSENSLLQGDKNNRFLPVSKKSFFKGSTNERFFRFPNNRFLRQNEKAIFSISEKSLIPGATKKQLIRISNFYFGATKKHFFRSRKIAYLGRHEKSNFSVFEKSLLQEPRRTDVSGFRKICFFGTTKKQHLFPKNRFFRAPLKSDFFRFPKNRFFWAQGNFFLVSEKSLFQGFKKNDFFSYRKIALSGRNEKAIISVSEKLPIHGATIKRFFRFPKNRFFRAP